MTVEVLRLLISQIFIQTLKLFLEKVFRFVQRMLSINTCTLGIPRFVSVNWVHTFKRILEICLQKLKVNLLLKMSYLSFDITMLIISSIVIWLTKALTNLIKNWIWFWTYFYILNKNWKREAKSLYFMYNFHILDYEYALLCSLLM